jgi:hypothetical protein
MWQRVQLLCQRFGASQVRGGGDVDHPKDDYDRCGSHGGRSGVARRKNAGSGAGVVTVFDHAKLDASFANSLAKGDSAPLWSQNRGAGDAYAHSSSVQPHGGTTARQFMTCVLVSDE